jgi:hypothetical protein
LPAMIGAISTGLRAYCRSPSQTGRAIVPPCWASAAPCPRDAPGRPASCPAWRRPLPAAFDGQTHRLSWLLCVPLPLAPPPETHAHTPHAHAARAFTPMQGAAGATTAPHGRVPRASPRQVIPFGVQQAYAYTRCQPAVAWLRLVCAVGLVSSRHLCVRRDAPWLLCCVQLIAFRIQTQAPDEW